MRYKTLHNRSKQSKNYVTVIQEISKMISISISMALISFVAIGCGKIEQERTNGHDSVIVAQKLVKNNPSNPNAYADLGNAFRDQGKYELAIENHKKSLSLDSQDAATHAELGDDYILAGQKEKAHAEWLTALRLDKHVPPTDVRLHVEKMQQKYP